MAHEVHRAYEKLTAGKSTPASLSDAEALLAEFAAEIRSAAYRSLSAPVDAALYAVAQAAEKVLDDRRLRRQAKVG